MDEEVSRWCAKLTEAVSVAMKPEVVQERRLQAYQLCEEFKETAPYSHCMACGQQLASLRNPTVIRHFGLQLLENCVKFQWINAGASDKQALKEYVLSYFQNGTHDLLEEQMCIKDGLSRILVEMIKREWPQHWPTLMSEFNMLCSHGDTQTELVLLVLLRLVEDVVAFQNLQTSRRRDILQALTSHMAELFTFMVHLLTHHIERLKQLQNQLPGAEKELASSIRVSQAVLLTLTGYVDWVASQHIFADNNALLSTLYSLLNIQELKRPAAEVLQLIVNRKGKPEERYPLLVLFSADAIKTILAAAQNACSAGLDEENYIFMKRLCQVLTGLGAQLCILWGSELKDVGRPESFPDFLETLLAFLGHPSMHLCSVIVPLLSAFFRHDQISLDPSLQGKVPQILQILTAKLQKVGYPSRDDSPTCTYSLLDYDSDEEFSYSFSIHRTHQTELVRLVTDHCPLLTFQVACDWFRQLIVSPIDIEPGKETCTPHSPSCIGWDALTCFMENVLARLFQSDVLTEITPQLVQLLQMTLSFQTEDPTLLSYVLSTISTLFPVVKEKPELMNAYLDKIFSAAVFSLPGQTKTRTRPVQNVRRHACSALVKICRDNSEFMVHFFDELYRRIKLLNGDQDQLTQLEKSTLNEVLILLSNEFNDLDKQSALIQEIMEPVTGVWMADAMKEVFGNGNRFLEHIGLCKAQTSPPQDDKQGANRATILACISTMMAVMKRSKRPHDPQKLAGDFHASSGIVSRDPCCLHILPLLDNVLALMRTMNAIWSPEIRATIPVEFFKVFDIPEHDKNAVLGLTQPSDNYELPANRSTAEKIQSFLSTAQENCCHVLASACDSLGYELYSFHPFIAQLVQSAPFLLNHAPDYKLRPVIRVFMKSLVLHCPVDCQDQVLLPVLNCLCAFMLQRLSLAWDAVNKRIGMGEESESREANQESQEIIDEMFLRLITRDYLDLLSTVFKKRSAGTGYSGSDIQMETVDSESVASAEGGHKATEPEQLGELGKKILQHESLCKSMVMCIYSSLSWNDTQTCTKSLNMCWPIFQQIVDRPILPGAVKYLFSCLLLGLEVHGQHETCTSLLVQKTFQHYEILRPRFDILQEVMLQIPGVTREILQTFDHRFIFNEEHKKPISEKSRRDNFKKMISGVIGRHIGQMFRREIIIKDLKPVRKPAKRSTTDFTENADIGLVALFAHDDS
ncbi:exportin-5-like isoform X2 [Patiria miniata]|uniref:Importin N-terminal domain-containing protein n=1 Tax=Patiria miniata TaxID=46514 RepID=A0A914BFR6_PATMI|nr:exportin-5-like isoform X2 [Patiria miniata]